MSGAKKKDFDIEKLSTELTALLKQHGLPGGLILLVQGGHPSIHLLSTVSVLTTTNLLREAIETLSKEFGVDETEREQ